MNRVIETLHAKHDCSAFTCGHEWLDRYLQKNALRNQERGYGRTYVACRDDATRRIDGYFTLSMSSVQFATLPPALIFKQMPRYPMPAAHMGCLAVASDSQRQGLGSLLLMDAMRRMIAASEVVAARAVEVKAIDDKAREWYLAYGFLPFADIEGPPFHLYLPIETAMKLVGPDESC